MVLWLIGQFFFKGQQMLPLMEMFTPLSWYMPREFALPALLFNTCFTSFTVLTYNITQVTARQRLCPEHLLGRMNASIRFMVWGCMPIGAFISGVLGSTIGLIPTIWFGAVMTVFTASFVLFSPLRTMREMPTKPD